MAENPLADQPRPRIVGAPIPAAGALSAGDGRPEPRSGAAVALSGVGRVFAGADGPVEALRGIDLVVAPGEFCVVVGPSGCGKTTFLRLVAGLDRPTNGSITVERTDGRPASNAMVFQGRSVFPWSTVRDNVAYGLRLRGVPKRERRATAENWLERVGLARFANAYPHQLSEGMRQRVAIARALAVDPDLLLMDEPFGALDEQTRLLLQEELLAIWESTGKTVVFITHSIDEAILLGDRIVVFGANPGTVKAELAVPFPRPRSLATVRSDPAFAPLFDRIWSLLRGDAERSQRRLRVVKR